MASLDRHVGDRRCDDILRRARDLALSGRYSDYRAIVWQLRQEGFPEARDVLGTRTVRAELDGLCKGREERRPLRRPAGKTQRRMEPA